jgi:hypothetical protein
MRQGEVTSCYLRRQEIKLPELPKRCNDSKSRRVLLAQRPAGKRHDGRECASPRPGTANLGLSWADPAESPSTIRGRIQRKLQVELWKKL